MLYNTPIEPLEERRLLAVLTVDTASDAHALNASSSPEINASGDISLRSAVEYLNATDTGADTIEFSLTSGTTALDLTLGQIEIAESMTIAGSGPNLLTINQTTSGAGVFQVDATDGNRAAVSFSLSDLTIGGGEGPANGGAIVNNGTLDVLETTISGN